MGTSQNMQIVDDGAAAEIKKILPCATITSPPSLPPANMGQGMLNRHPFSKESASLWSLLTLSQFNEQGFAWVNTHAASFCAGCALSFQHAHLLPNSLDTLHKAVHFETY